MQDIADFHAALASVDIIIDDSYNFSPATDLTQFNATYSLPASVHARVGDMIFRTDGLRTSTAGSDWYESAIPEPDEILQELMTIVLPKYSPDHSRVWIRNLAKGEPVRCAMKPRFVCDCFCCCCCCEVLQAQACVLLLNDAFSILTLSDSPLGFVEHLLKSDKAKNRA